MNDIIGEWEAEEQRRRDALPTRKATILAALEAAGIALVLITYDGEGDSGQIETITAMDAAGHPQPDSLKAEVSPGKSLESELDDFVWDILDAYHGGFENDGGGLGEIVINAAAGTVVLDHNDRLTHYANTTTEV
jgi:hypothetical protein